MRMMDLVNDCANAKMSDLVGIDWTLEEILEENEPVATLLPCAKCGEEHRVLSNQLGYVCNSCKEKEMN